MAKRNRFYMPLPISADGRIETNCARGCKCPICLEFAAGYRAGLEDGAIKVRQALEGIIRGKV